MKNRKVFFFPPYDKVSIEAIAKLLGRGNDVALVSIFEPADLLRSAFRFFSADYYIYQDSIEWDLFFSGPQLFGKSLSWPDLSKCLENYEADENSTSFIANKGELVLFDKSEVGQLIIQVIDENKKNAIINTFKYSFSDFINTEYVVTSNIFVALWLSQARRDYTFLDYYYSRDVNYLRTQLSATLDHEDTSLIIHSDILSIMHGEYDCFFKLRHIGSLGQIKHLKYLSEKMFVTSGVRLFYGVEQGAWSILSNNGFCVFSKIVVLEKKIIEMSGVQSCEIISNEKLEYICLVGLKGNRLSHWDEVRSKLKSHAHLQEVQFLSIELVKQEKFLSRSFLKFLKSSEQKIFLSRDIKIYRALGLKVLYLCYFFVIYYFMFPLLYPLTTSVALFSLLPGLITLVVAFLLIEIIFPNSFLNQKVLIVRETKNALKISIISSFGLFALLLSWVSYGNGIWFGGVLVLAFGSLCFCFKNKNFKSEIIALLVINIQVGFFATKYPLTVLIKTSNFWKSLLFAWTFVIIFWTYKKLVHPKKHDCNL